MILISCELTVLTYRNVDIIDLYLVADGDGVTFVAEHAPQLINCCNI